MILVAGGNGNMGRAVCEGLAAENKKVISIGRRYHEGKLYKHLQVDITDKKKLAALFGEYRFSTIIHLASVLYSLSNSDPLAAAGINVNGSLNLIELCKEHKTRFIYGSSVTALGKNIGAEVVPITETMPSRPQEYYGSTKRFVETTGLLVSNKSPFEFIAARIPNILGPGQGSKNSPWREEIFSSLKEKITVKIGISPDVVMPFAHIDDVVSAISKLVNADRLDHRVYNLPCESLKIADLIAMVKAINKEITVISGESDFIGMPEEVSWERFKKEFDYSFKSIQERLQMASA